MNESDIRKRRTGDNELEVAFTYHGYGGAVQRLLDALAQIEGVHGRPTTPDQVSG